ncbi:MAG: metal ABC transporter substrate-binding protein [Clostridia bacterium]|nr:metal ABC transporter substrate-binding protein [Clostridia bacterium]
MKKFFTVFLSFLLITALFCACSGEKATEGTTKETPTENKKLSVVCSIFPQYDFCKEIAGDKAELTLLLKSKVDMHNYKPSAEDILIIKNSDLFIDIGGESDEWADEVLETAKSENLCVLSLIDVVDAKDEEMLEGMEEEEHEEGEEHEEEKDEHVWTSLKNAELIVKVITEKLCSLDEKNAEEYRKNSAFYLSKLSALEKEYAETVKTAKRKTLLFGDRFPFRYLADDYSLECFAAFSGCSAETQASFETIKFLVEKVKEKDLPFVLKIDGSDGSVAETIASQSKAEVRTLNSCQSVSEDDIENGTNYLSIMTDNLSVLREVLN